MNREDLSVVGVLLEDPLAWHHGLGLSDAAAIGAGTIYPVLARLERSGWLESRWDRSGDSPRRRLYRLTGVGQRCGATALAERHAALPLRPSRRRFGFRLPRFGEALG
jgi:PadR family transcriptional regulator, regulatory protein PadR